MFVLLVVCLPSCVLPAAISTLQACIWVIFLHAVLVRLLLWSCTMRLQIARSLYTWTGNAFYADYYERALVNGILGVARLHSPEEHGHAEEEEGRKNSKRKADRLMPEGLYF